MYVWRVKVQTIQRPFALRHLILSPESSLNNKVIKPHEIRFVKRFNPLRRLAVCRGKHDRPLSPRQNKCVLTCCYITKVSYGMQVQMLICGELCCCVLHQHHHLNLCHSPHSTGADQQSQGEALSYTLFFFRPHWPLVDFSWQYKCQTYLLLCSYTFIPNKANYLSLYIYTHSTCQCFFCGPTSGDVPRPSVSLDDSPCAAADPRAAPLKRCKSLPCGGSAFRGAPSCLDTPTPARTKPPVHPPQVVSDSRREVCWARTTWRRPRSRGTFLKSSPRFYKRRRRPGRVWSIPAVTCSEWRITAKTIIFRWAKTKQNMASPRKASHRVTKVIIF